MTTDLSQRRGHGGDQRGCNYNVVAQYLVGRAGVIRAALCELHQGHVGIRFLLETNLMEGVYTFQRAGYSICATESERWQRGSIAVALRRDKECHLEGMTNYGPNVVSFVLMT